MMNVKILSLLAVFALFLNSDARPQIIGAGLQQPMGLQQGLPMTSGLQQGLPMTSGLQQGLPMATGLHQGLPMATGLQQGLPMATGLQQPVGPEIISVKKTNDGPFGDHVEELHETAVVPGSMTRMGQMNPLMHSSMTIKK